MNTPYKASIEADRSTGQINSYYCITAMPAYREYSVEVR